MEVIEPSRSRSSVTSSASVSKRTGTSKAKPAVMATPSALDPLVKEMLYIAVSVTNGCGYCIHSHTAAAKAKGMSEAEHADLLRVISLAAKTNQLATALQVPVDPAFDATAQR